MSKKNAQPDPNFSGGGFRNSDGEWIPATKSASYKLHRLREKLKESESQRNAALLAEEHARAQREADAERAANDAMFGR